ncbi:MAG: hypothetical protein IT461_08920 [Planctomycetes bacterium]|jgi:hypothetical protein|nr:hypothetical protein [Planctomycetota bacterium]
MQLLLTLAQSTPFEHVDTYTGAEEPINWGVLVFSLFGSLVIQVLFGWWAMMKAEEHDSNKIAAFFAGFLFLYAGVRMAPILRHDRIFNKPVVPRPLPPRQPRGPLPHAHGQPVPAQPQPPPSPSNVCPSCHAPRAAGRKNCMACGAAFPLG